MIFYKLYCDILQKKLYQMSVRDCNITIVIYIYIYICIYIYIYLNIVL